MKQILQNISTGETSLVEVPVPQNTDDSLLIQTRNTLVSAGTERMLVEFGKAGYLEKARQQPDKVKQVLAKIRTDGLLPTIEAVKSRLDQPIPLGYCNAGIVIDSRAEGFNIGDRVVSNGGHAEVVRVGKNLCAKIPDSVDDESAAFTVLAAVGLQGIRLLKPTLGETVVVIGLGLIGLMCVQMLRANGCRVLGVDKDSSKCKMARKFGAETVDLSNNEDLNSTAKNFSNNNGVDAVLITASSKSNEIIHQSADICRKRGRIVLVGVVGLDLRRDDFFKKEISFQVSASYGPGRYDPLYEEKGQDYPYGFVRWTEQRNFEAVLEMMRCGSLDVKSLISNRFSIDEANNAYNLLDDFRTLGIIIDYPVIKKEKTWESKITLNTVNNGAKSVNSTDVTAGFIGAGNYASRVLIPAFRESKANLHTLVTSGGVSSVRHGIKNKFNKASTNIDDVINSPEINTVVIATQHNLHAEQVIKALKSNKNVFVEKPLALKKSEIKKIDEVYQAAIKNSPLNFMVGFNRRFSPHIVKIKKLIENIKIPKSIIITINAGYIPKEHWVQDKKTGGGRIIGECCHFIDLLRHLIGVPVESYQAMMMGNAPGIDIQEDIASINLLFKDGSIGSIHYFANGGNAFPKERVEVFCNNAVLQLDNFKLLKGYNWKGMNKMKLFRQDKGQSLCVKSFIDSIKNGKTSPISYDEIIEVSNLTIDIAESLRNL